MLQGKLVEKRFLLKYPFARGRLDELGKVLSIVFKPECLFTASWVLRTSEDANMWTAYAQDGTGVALKTTVGKLQNASWKIPFSVSGLLGGQPRFGSLTMQKVRYLDFNSNDKLKCVEDCYVPFLKRDEFNSERELRLLGQSDVPLPKGGLTVPCDLRNMLTEIVIGPKADKELVRQRIAVEAPSLSVVLWSIRACAATCRVLKLFKCGEVLSFVFEQGRLRYFGF